ncbi:MAG: glycosyltransferase family 4 protein [Planctomycetaceae bacterium]|nr:glycosyltransferase family 4 protein [Planctomycetaceae bacterium]
MRIAYLAAGAANMYCGSCLHDNTLAAALVKTGADIVLVPTYTPLRVDEPSMSQQRVLFGGINLYLQEKIPLFRYTPRFLDRIFDATWLLRLIGKLDFSVDAAQLGSLTIAMLEGEQGHVRKEVFKLVEFLRDHIQPQVVHLTNALLIGMVREIKRELNVPVVCSLSGEDIFFEKLTPRYREQAQRLMRQRAAEVDQFVALNQYYADVMCEYLAVPRDRVSVVPHGLKLEGHGERRPANDGVFRIGYLARVCHDKGLHNLVAAFQQLAHDEQLPPVRLEVAGYLGASDRPYLEQIRRTIQTAGLSDRFEYRGELSRDEKIAFLQSLDVFSVPTEYRESKGLSILEALANGVPVVQPAHGSFVEMVTDSGGGLLYEPGNTAALVEQLRQLALNPAQAATLGKQGRAAVLHRYNDAEMARHTLDVYRRLV